MSYRHAQSRFMKLSRRKKKDLPLTTLQGLLLSLAIGVLVALVFAFVFYLYALPKWSE